MLALRAVDGGDHTCRACSMRLIDSRNASKPHKRTSSSVGISVYGYEKQKRDRQTDRQEEIGEERGCIRFQTEVNTA